MYFPAVQKGGLHNLTARVETYPEIKLSALTGQTNTSIYTPFNFFPLTKSEFTEL